jgi:aspartokinase
LANITKATEEYIQTHPYAKECIKKKLINYSSLSRQICEDLNLELKRYFDAVLIACRRYYNKIQKEESFENKILNILKNSKLEIRNKISVIVLEKNILFSNLIDIEKEAKKILETIHIIESSSAVTVITSAETAKGIKRVFKNKIIKEYQDLVEIILKSPIQIITTSGVASYLFSILGENGINILDTLSSYTDTIFVIEEKDLSRTMQLLKF